MRDTAIGAQVPIWGGPGGVMVPAGTVSGQILIWNGAAWVPTTPPVLAFTNADLVGGVLTFAHGLAAQYVRFTIYDNVDVETVPDLVTATAAGTADIDLSRFGVIPGTWHAVASI